MKFYLAFIILWMVSLQVKSQVEKYDVELKVFSEKLYCGDVKLTEEELETYRDRSTVPNLVFYSINLSKKATGEIMVTKWVVDENSAVQGQFEPGDYLIIDDEDYKKVVSENFEENTFILTGKYLRSLVRNGSARLYIPVNPPDQIELVFWIPCNE